MASAGAQVLKLGVLGLLGFDLVRFRGYYTLRAMDALDALATAAREAESRRGGRAPPPGRVIDAEVVRVE